MVSHWPLVSTRFSDSCLYASGHCHPLPPQVRPKDRLYYKKLLDRYFGANHALAQDIDSVSSSSAVNTHSRSSDQSGVNRTWNAAASVGGSGGGGRGGGGGGGRGSGGGDEGGGKVVRVSMQQFPQVHLAAYASHNNNNAVTASPVHFSTRHAHHHCRRGGDPEGGGSDLDSEAESEVSGLRFAVSGCWFG